MTPDEARIEAGKMLGRVRLGQDPQANRHRARDEMNIAPQSCSERSGVSRADGLAGGIDASNRCGRGSLWSEAAASLAATSAGYACDGDASPASYSQEWRCGDAHPAGLLIELG
jgi:hypothetical protein